jgi:hypothetical protein
VVEPLGRIGPKAAPAVPLLMKLLQKEMERGREFPEECLIALGKIGPAAHLAVPLIEQAMQTDLGEVRVLAAQALWQIDPKRAPEAAAAMFAALEDSRGRAQWFVMHFLAAKGPAAKVALPFLVEQIRQDRSYFGPILRQIDSAVAAELGFTRRTQDDQRGYVELDMLSIAPG